MTDLNLFRALEQSRRIIEEEFAPRATLRLASEVIGAATTPKYLSATPAGRVRIGKLEIRHGH